MPANTATGPITRLSVIGSSTSAVASSAAATGSTDHRSSRNVLEGCNRSSSLTIEKVKLY
jgi:hypothetical protein